MATIVESVKAELVKLKTKVEEAIEHVEAGIENLNEDQLEALEGLIEEIGTAHLNAQQNIGDLLAPGGPVTEEPTEPPAPGE